MWWWYQQGAVHSPPVFFPSFSSCWPGPVLGRCGFTVRTVVQDGCCWGISWTFSTGCTEPMAIALPPYLFTFALHLLTRCGFCWGEVEACSAFTSLLSSAGAKAPFVATWLNSAEGLEGGEGKRPMLCHSSFSWLALQVSWKSQRVFVSSHTASTWSHDAPVTPVRLPLLSCIGFHLNTNSDKN